MTHFVDDRSDVLNHLVGIVEHLYLFGARSRGKWPAFTRVGSWPETEEAIRRTLGELAEHQGLLGLGMSE